MYLIPSSIKAGEIAKVLREGYDVSRLTEGFQAAFLACAVLAGIGAALAILLLGRPRGVTEQLEPVPASSED